jgi:hypothetical protein
MTTLERISEFEFVKESLKEEHYSPFSLFQVECGEGWSDLIYNLCKKLDELKFDGTVQQIKEKFGGLRFYISAADKDVYDLIDEAENESFNICESCGRPGKCIKKNWLLMTRCEECSK